MGKSQQEKKAGGKTPMEFIVKELKFSEAQLKDFNRINKNQRREMDAIDNALRRTKDALFEKVTSESIQKSKIDSLAIVIGESEKTKELLVFNHLRSIQELCNEKQKQKFKSILKDALHKGRGVKEPRDPSKFQGPDGYRPPPPRH
ncbi:MULTISPECIES: hypothetical protein [unclassified Tamlana]|uniref:hypothetical protein n=1 Tax=unclassified Tamlana TaxID=2614803 RepID=UPI0026E2EB28|nr:MULTISPECIES: hypothetical protein [unclassified Tamlana]MDO6790222.1 hypothetical protein [Tamlana sp. 1_MG-2023]